jgi:hypothetical protein
VAYLYDGAVHEQMTRFATAAIRAGRLPFTSWFPLVGLGAPQYSDYQSLASVLAGLAGVAVGAGNAYRWSLYLLVALWPFAVYGSARLFGISRGAGAAAAVIAPFVVSFTGIGFEQNAYSYTGGAEVWTQLFGSWALAFAWATSWRAFSDLRYLWLAAGLSGLTIAFHFECGYLALLGVMVMALFGPGRLGPRLALGAVLLVGSLGAAAWVVVPLWVGSKWSAINQALAATVYVRGYGAGKELQWLFTGQIFDARRSLPVISVVVAGGALFALARWRSRPLERCLLALFGATFVLSFGPTTFGAFADLVPAHSDLYFRRFTMGTQLAGLYLAGIAVARAWGLLERRAWPPLQALLRYAAGAQGAPARPDMSAGPAMATRPEMATRRPDTPASAAVAGLALAFAALWLSPAVLQLYRYDRTDAAVIHAQREADTTQGRTLSPLVAYVKAHGGGRVYAGLSDNWGQDFLVGVVPVYKYLLGQGVEEMAYVVPSMSLMLVPEGEFDEANPADYALFGVRYVILPAGADPLVAARFVMARGAYSLWALPSVGYLHPVTLTGSLTADRADVGRASAGMLVSIHLGQDWSVAFAGAHPPHAVAAAVAPADDGAPGVVLRPHVDLSAGTASAVVRMKRAGALLLSASYQPGWHVSVDGRGTPALMLAPALVGVQLSRGLHRVAFRFEGFAWYPELWAASLLCLVALGRAGAKRRRARP